MITSCPPSPLPSLCIYLLLGSGYWPLEFCAGVALRRNRHKHGLSFALHRPLGEQLQKQIYTYIVYICVCQYINVFICVYLILFWFRWRQRKQPAHYRIANALIYMHMCLQTHIYTHTHTFKHLHAKSMNNSRATRVCHTVQSFFAKALAIFAIKEISQC